MKIGIMGGTFDPIHNGHLMLGKAAYEKFGLDQIWFMPNGNPPHKKQASIGSDIETRIRMVELAIAPHPEFVLELYESDPSKVSCSYQTLEHFQTQYPEDELYFIVGADSLFAIETWVKPGRIFPTCTFLAAYRDEIDTAEEMQTQIAYLKKKYHARIEILATPLMDVSSHELRQRIQEQESIRSYVPSDVADYIEEHCLYQNTEGVAKIK